MDNRMDIALGRNIDNQNSIRKGGNKYNGVDIGNNTSVNSREDIDKDSSASNNFGNNTYKLVFKGIKSRNQKRTINILYCQNYKQLIVIVKLFRKTLRAKPNISLWYTIRKGVKSILFNNKNLDIFRIRIKEGLGKANTLQSIIGLEEQLFYIVVII